MGWTGEPSATTKTVRRAPSRGGLRLLVMADGDVTAHELPERGEVTIGRAPTALVRVQHESISRLHAAIAIGDALTIEDRGSRNGVYVRGERIPVNQPIAITPAELVELGAVAITVQHVYDRRSQGARKAVDDENAALVVRDPAMRELYALVQRVASSSIPVLVVGETGVGKEVIAAELHRRSSRADRPYLRINCAALPEQLLESELFGHEKGAFTGAASAKPGLFEVAHGGTILLDEVAEIPVAMQAKLLRALDEHKVMRVGAVTATPFDARFVAATNRDLNAEIARGTFREDLFFRLAAVTIAIPPLRDRPDEIVPLALAVAGEAWRRDGRSGRPKLTSAAIDALRRHRWPGNVRELRNVVERAIVVCDGDTIDSEHVQLVAARQELVPASGDMPLRDEARALERRRILDALDRCAGNQSAAARLLGMPRRTLVTRLGEYGLPRPRKK
jgi:DNA-binding NtrC family response regulator